MRIGLLALMLSVVALGDPAQAQKVYATVQLGRSFVSDSTLTDSFGNRTEMVLDSAFSTAASVGTYYRRNVRLEGEFSYSSNAIDSFLDTGGLDGGSGDFDALGFMANAFYDVPAVRIAKESLLPYVGVGLGFAKVSLDNATRGNNFFADDSDIAFAWQLGAGIAYAIERNVRLMADYRYFSTTELSFKDANGNSFNAEYARHTVRIGLRYDF